MGANRTIPPTAPRKSATFDAYALSEIRRAAATGIYDIRGAGRDGGAPFRRPPVPRRLDFALPLEGYREKCGTDVSPRHALRQEPIELKIRSPLPA